MTGPLLLLAVVALLAAPFVVAFTPLELWDRARSALFAVLVFFFACLVCCLGVP